MTTPMRMALAAAVGALLLGSALFLGRVDDRSAARPSVAAPSMIPTRGSPPPTAPLDTTAIDAAGFGVPFRMTWDIPVRTDVRTDVVDAFGSDGGGFKVFLVGQVGKDPCRTNELRPEPLRTPQELMDWLASIPNARVTPVSSVSVGGYDGLSRELDVGDLNGCIDSSQLHSGIRTDVDAASGGFGMAAGGRERWVALAVDGKLVAFVVWPLQDQAFVDAADRALSTIDFVRCGTFPQAKACVN